MGAIQAQDYAASKWALALRLKDAKEKQIEKAINNSDIIRTHILRPTWHYVAASEIRWMMQLSGPRVQAFNGPMYRKHGLDADVFKHSRKALEKALQGNNHLTRTELATALNKAKIDTSDLRIVLLMMQAELDSVICSGVKRDKQFTYALLDERVPQSAVLTRDEALAKLALIYFNSRGPATLADFTWWSGLTVKDAKSGLESVKEKLSSESIDNTTYWLHRNKAHPMPKTPYVLLIPAFDEYTVAYKDRSTIMDKTLPAQTPFSVLGPQITIDGVLSGSWKRTLTKEGAEVELKPLRKFSKAEQTVVDKEIARYNDFLNG